MRVDEETYRMQMILRVLRKWPFLDHKVEGGMIGRQ